MRTTNRWLVSGLACAALAIVSIGVQSATAEAPTATASGGIKYRLADPLPGNADLLMFVRSKQTSTGKIVPKYVDTMGVSDVLMTCDEGYVTTDFSTKDDIKINRSGEFTYSFSSFNASFTGTVTKGGKKAAGTVSFGPGNTVVGGPDYDGATFTNCSIDGGPIDYTAKYV